MPRYVVISTNSNPDYKWYIPIVKWAWKQFGWEVLCYYPFVMNGIREETITQCIRLYAADYFNGDGDPMLMTSDADMIPMADYWNPAPNEITCYGHDLTGYKHYPICYIAMNVRKWRQVMNLTRNVYEDMKRDLENSNARSQIKHEWWCVDQDIITDRLQGFDVTKIDRGIEPGGHLPLGRMDRYGMKYPGTMIDFHAPRDPIANAVKIDEVLTRGFGDTYLQSDIRKYVLTEGL